MILSIFYSIILLTTCSSTSIENTFTFKKENEGIRLTYGSSPVFFYQAETKSIEGRYPRANYLHPVYGLNGEVLTEDFPDDHLHHRGIFWAWHQFYVRNKKVGDSWECRDINWEVENIQTNVFNDSAVFSTEIYWTGLLPDDSDSLNKKLLKEETKITVKNISDSRREIEFNIRLIALYEGTAIGGSEDHKGYGGFSIRTKLPEDLTFYSENGIVEPIETAIHAGGWIDMRGTFDPDVEDQTYITIMCDPDDPRPFHGWILRDKNSMQNAAFPGSEPVKIPIGESLQMKYKLLFHTKSMSKEEIQNNYDSFIQ
jgi:hypothetical protein